ncbi:ABC transporter, ATP-binding protein [Leptospira interrogans str. UT126]|uniref:ABC transporter ATP-binding protein n=1 Tax=Leptospira interrogans TaxID=173 RepID=UPI0002BD3BBE|nr:ABC transporter ATP-binding protein [Leptospira interrogans]EMJ54188.1 ABC transporter, ATP-binding protein [Leptospira interrogans str. UT126]MBE0305547.1 ABC transporter ATP-binding protein [Leptospira interrogans serovar Yeoncheon]
MKSFNNFNKQIKTKTSIGSIFLEFLNQYPKQFGFLFFLLILEGLIAAISVFSIVPLADFLLDATLTKPSQITKIVLKAFELFSVLPNFWHFGFLFFIMNLWKGFLDVTIRFAILKIKYAVVRGLLGETLRSFFSARWEFFSSAENGRLLNTFNKELNTIGDTLGGLATLLAQTIQLLIYLTVPLWLNTTMTITALGLSLVFGLPFLLLHKLSYRLGKQNTETGNIAMGVLSEIVSSARIILGFGRQKEARDRYLKALDQHVNVTLKSQTLSTAIPKFFQPLAMLAAVIAMGLAISELILISELAAVMWSLLACLPLIASLIQSNVSISNFLPSYEQLLSLREKAVRFQEIEGTRIFSKLENSIQLKDLSFTYPGRSKTLDCINLNILKGKMTAFAGESGAGKSTITDLILGLQIPDEGYVLIDGISLKEWKQNSFRERIGYVPQDPVLFHSSIRENLLWSMNSVAEKELWEALSLANAENFVRELPNGIDTVVGDKGTRLSGGQRQRIALARAILRKPELLILDEATSSLDSESETLIQRSIEQVAKGTTVIVVAHRLSTIAKADMVYVLSQGKILEQGSFAQLSVKPEGILEKMIKTQLSLKNL